MEKEMTREELSAKFEEKYGKNLDEMKKLVSRGSSYVGKNRISMNQKYNDETYALALGRLIRYGTFT